MQPQRKPASLSDHLAGETGPKHLVYACPFLFKPESLKTHLGVPEPLCSSSQCGQTLCGNLLSPTFTIIGLFNWHIEDEWPSLLVLLGETQFKDSLGEKQPQGAREAEGEESPSSTLKLLGGGGGSLPSASTLPGILKSSRLEL